MGTFHENLVQSFTNFKNNYIVPIQTALNNKQNKTDNTLDTNSKTVVGAINEVNTEVGKTYKTSDSSSTTVNTTDYVPMSTSANAKKKVTWSTLLSKIKAAITGATVKTSVAKTGSGSTVTTSISADTSMDDVVETLLNNDYKLNSELDKGSVSVTADGVKTYAQIMQALFASVNISKVRKTSMLVTEATIPEGTYRGVFRVQGWVGTFIRCGCTLDGSIEYYNLSQSGGKVTRGYINQNGAYYEDRSANVPSSGMKFTFVY